MACTLLMIGWAGLTLAANPRRIDLWLSPAPSDGQLQQCQQQQPESSWILAGKSLLLLSDANGIRVQQLGIDGSRNYAWTQRCLQLRDGVHVIVQGALIPANSARRLPAWLPVLVLENRARFAPEMTLHCGFPAAIVTNQDDALAVICQTPPP